MYALPEPSSAGGLAPMAHDVVVPDADVLALVKAEEARLCPEATENLLENPAPVGQEIAWLAAEAMRRQAGVEEVGKQRQRRPKML